MGYNSPPGDAIDQLITRITELERRCRELERPTGSQTAQALQKLRDLVNGLLEQTSVNVSGNVTAGGNVTATGILTATGGIISADVNTRTLAVSYDSVYIDASNRFGLSPSALRLKQDLSPHDFSPDIVDALQAYSFRLIEAVAQIGEEGAPYEIGYIADYLDQVGLSAFVRRDNEGNIRGIAYERLVIPVADAVKDLRQQVAQIQEQLSALSN